MLPRLYASYLTRAVALLAALVLPVTAHAGLIRDAEIEHTLAAYSRPIFESAGIPADSVRIFVMDNPQINAYVAGGLNLFINTGLIREAAKPGMLIGVIAHETGHIAGAHLSQLREKSTRAMIGSIIGIAAGAAAAVSGAQQAGAGIFMGSQSMVNNSFMGEIRLNEASADQAALTYLDANDISATGALEMFQALHRRELGGPNHGAFANDHPLTTERITAMRHHIDGSAIPADKVPEGFAAMHARMLAKLVAFSDPYAAVLIRYPESDHSVAGRYARAIAEFRRSNLPAALKIIDGLIGENPKDAYFYDTRGQFLFENGKIAEASTAYAKAASLASDAPLILTDYAKTLIASDKPAELPHALLLLERSKDLDDSYSLTWRQLALAYSKEGKMGQSYEALAEEAALNGDYRTVIKHVARARADAVKDSSLALALDDLERDAKTQLESKRGNSPF